MTKSTTNQPSGMKESSGAGAARTGWAQVQQSTPAAAAKGFNGPQGPGVRASWMGGVGAGWRVGSLGGEYKAAGDEEVCVETNGHAQWAMTGCKRCCCWVWGCS